jgi:uncharacterized protein DUF5985
VSLAVRCGSQANLPLWPDIERCCGPPARLEACSRSAVAQGQCPSNADALKGGGVSGANRAARRRSSSVAAWPRTVLVARTDGERNRHHRWSVTVHIHRTRRLRRTLRYSIGEAAEPRPNIRVMGQNGVRQSSKEESHRRSSADAVDEWSTNRIAVIRGAASTRMMGDHSATARPAARALLEYFAGQNLLDIRVTEHVRYQYRPGTPELQRRQVAFSMRTRSTRPRFGMRSPDPAGVEACVISQRLSGFAAMTIAELIYLLCAATSVVAALLLIRQYRSSRTPLLFWSSIAFLGLAVNNLLVYLDLGVFTTVDLALPRTIAGAVAMIVLVYGLVLES